MVAQRVIRDFGPGGPGRLLCERVASTELWDMCLDATPWSGVRRLVCSAHDEDAERVGSGKARNPLSGYRRRNVATDRGARHPTRRGHLGAVGKCRGRGDVYDVRQDGS